MATATTMAFLPKQDGIPVKAVSGATIELTRYARLILVAPGRYELVSGAYAGQQLDLSWEASQSLLKIATVWSPEWTHRVRDLGSGELFSYDPRDRFIYLPDTAEYLIIAGPNQGKRVAEGPETEGVLQKHF